MSAPHGGRLVNRLAPEGNVEELRDKARRFPVVELTRRELCDLELLGVGAFSPLEGFLDFENFRSVIESKRLANGLTWTIPITLSVSRDQALGRYAALAREGRTVGILEVGDRYEYPKECEADLVYGTKDPSHPGVKATLERKDLLIGGTVTLLERSFPESLTPAETRAEFARRGWKRVAAFQTRNPIHRAHEYLTKVALETVDGLLIHPLVGETKSDDIPADVRERAYRVLIEKYYPASRVVLATLPASMRYGGPREAVHHAIIRQNYGATHFIVGRDHAGVGKFYGPYDAQTIFDDVEVAITPLRFENTFYCSACEGLASAKTCPHGPETRLMLSGTQVREKLAKGEDLPGEFTRPEVAEVLREHYATMACTPR
jgi:sulfate adenylyltransferase